MNDNTVIFYTHTPDQMEIDLNLTDTEKTTIEEAAAALNMSTDEFVSFSLKQLLKNLDVEHRAKAAA